MCIIMLNSNGLLVIVIFESMRLYGVLFDKVVSEIVFCCVNFLFVGIKRRLVKE